MRIAQRNDPVALSRRQGRQHYEFVDCSCSLLLALVHSPFPNCRRLREKQLGRLVYPLRKLYLGGGHRAFHFRGEIKFDS